jgi:hypothetical protein
MNGEQHANRPRPRTLGHFSRTTSPTPSTKAQTQSATPTAATASRSSPPISLRLSSRWSATRTATRLPTRLARQARLWLVQVPAQRPALSTASAPSRRRAGRPATSTQRTHTQTQPPPRPLWTLRCATHVVQVSEQALPQIARQSATAATPCPRGAVSPKVSSSADWPRRAWILRRPCAPTRSGNGLTSPSAAAKRTTTPSSMRSSQRLYRHGSGRHAGVDASAQHLSRARCSTSRSRRRRTAGSRPGATRQLHWDVRRAWDNLMKYYGIVGSKQWGGTQSGHDHQHPEHLADCRWPHERGGSLMKSDRRVKHDIYQIGEAPTACRSTRSATTATLPATSHIGLMAQDVELVKPEAVVTIDGVKHVNYELALAE